MKKIMNLVLIFALLVGMIGCPVTSVEAKTKTKTPSEFDKAIKYAKNEYYGTNVKIKKKVYKDSGAPGSIKDFVDENYDIRKSVIYSGNEGLGIKGGTVEYYYDKKHRLVFAFAYKKVKGKTYEYRAYYGTNGKLYRYINAKGEVKDYKKGKDMVYSEDSKSMPQVLYSKGMRNIMIAYE